MPLAVCVLVYDIQELFRWIIDLSVIQLLEEMKLKKSDFIVTENYHVRLKENTAKMLIDKIRINFNSFTPHKGKNYSYQNILFDNMQRLASFVSERDKELAFNVSLVRIEREDSKELRERILNMTPEERKRLGISKTTLCYQKKKIIQGSKLKICDNTLSKMD